MSPLSALRCGRLWFNAGKGSQKDLNLFIVKSYLLIFCFGSQGLQNVQKIENWCRFRGGLDRISNFETP